MLIDMETLRGIRDGGITHVFRRWEGARAKAGGRQRTPVGELEIGRVDSVPDNELSETDARSGGYANLAALNQSLARGRGTIWRIEVRWVGEDPRVALGNDASPEGLEGTRKELAAMDRRSKSGPWVWRYLKTIGGHEGVRAEELAQQLGIDKRPFKTRVRRLKELGLTISLSPGYRLSVRGRALLRLSET